MGHRAGWLALGSGIAGGADVILIPEIPYSIDKIATAIGERRKRGKNFSIVAVAEGALTISAAKILKDAKSKIDNAEGKDKRKKLKDEYYALEKKYTGQTMALSQQLEEID